MEHKKFLKDTLLFLLFSCYHDQYKKMTKVYLVAFSCIFECKNEWRLSSRFLLQNPKKVFVHVTNKEEKWSYTAVRASRLSIYEKTLLTKPLR